MNVNWEVLMSITMIVAGAVLVVCDEKEMGAPLITLGIGSRIGSFTRAKAEAAKP